MKPPYLIPTEYDVIHGDCVEVMSGMESGSIDAIVTDPPYGLEFMGKEFDKLGDGPKQQEWHYRWAVEALRVLKPGGYLLAFGGTRTYHRLACAVEDAGFEIRDQMQWMYGCVSEDTEVLTDSGWDLYHRANGKRIAIFDAEKHTVQWEKPEGWSVYNVEQDTAYRVRSGETDQIVSRGHRCLVERDGKLIFAMPDKCSGMEVVPTLPDDFCVEAQKISGVLQSPVQRSLQGSGLEEVGKGRIGKVQPTGEQDSQGEQGSKEPSVEGRSDVYQAQGEVCESVDKACEVSTGVSANGSQGRVCDGTQVVGGDGSGEAAGEARVCPSCGSRCHEQQSGEFDFVCEQCGSQEIRAWSGYSTTLATIEPIKYSGVIFCPTVSTGAFVARRNGKVFVTGNSGFPKSLDVSKAIDKSGGGGAIPQRDTEYKSFAMEVRSKREALGLTRSDLKKWFPEYGYVTENWERLDDGFRVPSEEAMAILIDRLGVDADRTKRLLIEDLRRRKAGAKADRCDDGTVYGLAHDGSEYESTTDIARLWAGYGTALKPAHEPIVLARKPLGEKTVAKNVLKHGTGGINVDGCRVVGVKPDTTRGAGGQHGITSPRGAQGRILDDGKGRFPANVILTHHPECECVGTKKVGSGEVKTSKGEYADGVAEGYKRPNKSSYTHKESGHVKSLGEEEVEAWDCHPDCPVRILDEQSGISTSSGGGKNNGDKYGGGYAPSGLDRIGKGDSGGASRFFYCAKASKSERTAGLARGKKNKHPTVKPAHEPCVLARKPLSEKTVAANVLKHGTGGINIDGCRVGAPVDTERLCGKALIGTFEGQERKVSGRDDVGRFPANVILTHHPECECVGTKKVKGSQLSQAIKRSNSESASIGKQTDGYCEGYTDEDGNEEVEAWNCHPDCPVKILDEQSGISKDTAHYRGSGGGTEHIAQLKGRENSVRGVSDKGGASRFFYCAKASKSERTAGLARGKKNKHPTVKPVDLMAYLCRLVTPPGGTVFDPFCGSGSTGVGARLEGFHFVGVDQDEEYVEVARVRIDNYMRYRKDGDGRPLHAKKPKILKMSLNQLDLDV